MKYKIGDCVKVTDSNTDMKPHSYLGEIVETDECSMYEYGVISFDGKISRECRESELELAKKDWDTLQVGDILTNYGSEYTVLAVIGDAFLKSSMDDPTETGGWYAKKEAIRDGYKIKEADSDDVVIEIEGNKKTISRKSAKELNLLI